MGSPGSTISGACGPSSGLWDRGVHRGRPRRVSGLTPTLDPPLQQSPEAALGVTCTQSQADGTWSEKISVTHSSPHLVLQKADLPRQQGPHLPFSEVLGTEHICNSLGGRERRHRHGPLQGLRQPAAWPCADTVHKRASAGTQPVPNRRSRRSHREQPQHFRPRQPSQPPVRPSISAIRPSSFRPKPGGAEAPLCGPQHLHQQTPIHGCRVN